MLRRLIINQSFNQSMKELFKCSSKLVIHNSSCVAVFFLQYSKLFELYQMGYVSSFFFFLIVIQNLVCY